jgi:hypothetical protein
MLAGASGVAVEVLTTALVLLGADAMGLGVRDGAADEAVVADDGGKGVVSLTRTAHDAEAGGAVKARSAAVWLSLSDSV